MARVSSPAPGAGKTHTTDQANNANARGAHLGWSLNLYASETRRGSKGYSSPTHPPTHPPIHSSTWAGRSTTLRAGHEEAPKGTSSHPPTHPYTKSSSAFEPPRSPLLNPPTHLPTHPLPQQERHCQDDDPGGGDGLFHPPTHPPTIHPPTHPPTNINSPTHPPTHPPTHLFHSKNVTVKKTILEGVTGSVRSGNMMALMGASGKPTHPPTPPTQ